MIEKMSEHLVNEAIHDPSNVYDSPEDVLADKRLDKEDKKKILRSWAEDQEALIRAEGENMPKPSPGGRNAGETLQTIRDILKKMDESD